MESEDHHPCPRCGSELAADDTHGLCARCVVAELFAPDEAPDDAPLGEFGNYEILGKIAAGGMGVVYRARQKGLNRIVALKLIPEGRLAGENDINRFLFEARAAAELEHPNIAPIYEVGEAEGQPFFTMRFVDGGNLSDWIEDLHAPGKGLVVRENLTHAVRMMVKIARAIAYAHGRGIIHRDLKPPNILVDHHGEPQITDFGIAKRLGANEHLTLTGQALGSPAFMAPEQSTGGDPGPTTDVYALGVVLYQMLSGELPFQAETPLELIKQASQDAPKKLRAHNRLVDEELETICLKCLEKEPSDRFETAAALADDLSRWLAGEPILARPLPRAKRFARWANRNRGKVTVATSLVMLLLASTIYLTALRDQGRDQRSELYATHMGLAADKIAAKGANWRQSAAAELAAAASFLPDQSKPIEWKLLSGQVQPPLLLSGEIPQMGISGIAIAREKPLYLSVVTEKGTLSVWAVENVRNLRNRAFPVQEPMPFYNGGGETLLVRNNTGELETVGNKTPPDIPLDAPFLAQSGLGFASTEGTSGSKITGKVLASSGKPIFFEIPLPEAIQSLAIDGKKYLAFVTDGHFEVWDVTKSPPQREKWIDHHYGTTPALDFSSNGKHLATGTDDGTVRIWNTLTGKLEGTFSLGSSDIAAVAFIEPNATDPEQALIAISRDGNFKVWNLLGQADLDPAIMSLSPPLALSADAQFLMGSRAPRATMAVVNLRRSGLPLQELSPEGELLAVAYGETQITAFLQTAESIVLANVFPDGRETQIVRNFPNTDAKESSLAISPNGRNALILADSLLNTVDCFTGDILLERAVSINDRILALSDDTAAIGSRESSVRLLSVTSDEEFDLEAPPGASHAAFSIDGTRLAIAHKDSISTFIFDNTRWRKLDTVYDCETPGPLAWSIDHQTMIAADSVSRKLTFFETNTGRQLYPLEVLGDWKQVTCTEDGLRVIAATSNKVFVISVPVIDDASVSSKPK